MGDTPKSTTPWEFDGMVRQKKESGMTEWERMMHVYIEIQRL